MLASAKMYLLTLLWTAYGYQTDTIRKLHFLLFEDTLWTPSNYKTIWEKWPSVFYLFNRPKENVLQIPEKWRDFWLFPPQIAVATEEYTVLSSSILSSSSPIL